MKTREAEINTLPELAAPHFLRAAQSNGVPVRGGAAETALIRGGGARTDILNGGQSAKVTISFQIRTRPSDRPRPEVFCTASLPGGFSSIVHEELTLDPFSPDDMAAFLAELEASARKHLEAIVRSALSNLKEALGADP